MSPFRLLWKELLHRRISSLLALFSIAVAVALVVAALLVVQGYRTRLQARVADLDNEIRKITKAMGFNINILPKDQDLFDFHADGFGTKTMPFEFVQRLADSKDVVTINHLRPALVRKYEWPEYRREVILIGVTGVIPWTHRQAPDKPLAEAVAEGTLHLGNVLARQIGVREGSDVVLNGRELRVAKVYAPRGSQDDISVWVDLGFVQELLQLPGRINMIQALECNCASQDRLAEIDADISRVLGDEVQVIELSTQAIARARARVDVQRSGQQNLRAIQTGSIYASSLSSLAAGLMVGILFWQNAVQRKQEIGILRAIGTPARHILQLLLGKAALLGVVGALLGTGAGIGLAYFFLQLFPADFAATALSWPVGMLIVAVSTLVTVLTSWIPSLLALAQDPAHIVRND